MNISHLQAALASGLTDVQNSPEGPGAQKALQNRELMKAVQAMNDNQVFGPGNELRFSQDQDSGRSLIRIVDRVTNEVVNQIPPEELLRMWAVLNQLSGRAHFA